MLTDNRLEEIRDRLYGNLHVEDMSVMILDALKRVRDETAGAIKNSLDMRLNNYLCEMKPDYDDSITGFNEAWDIARKMFRETETP